MYTSLRDCCALDQVHFETGQIEVEAETHARIDKLLWANLTFCALF